MNLVEEFIFFTFIFSFDACSFLSHRNEIEITILRVRIYPMSCKSVFDDFIFNQTTIVLKICRDNNSLVLETF